ncbi:MAG: Nif3-like dinuclear metal center hexameric protein [Bacillota bacterium]|nr:Nif3-like dinuclear metal center hexameric protein [Bacillota bacterium]
METKMKKETRFPTVAEIVEEIDAAVPNALQEEWDNSGFLLGVKEMPVRKILTCLEINEDVIGEAAQLGAELIVTHHPLIFEGMKQIRDDDYHGRLVMELLAQGISVYSCHTPFDKVKGGNNDVLMKRLGLTGIKNLKGDDVESMGKMVEKQDPADIGRIGKFKKPYSFMQVIDLVSKELEVSLRQMRAVGQLDAEISTVGVCTGAGAEFLEMAKDSGCQLFITGDVKYHEAQMARGLDICLLDAGHYHTEKFFSEAMKALLEKKLDGDMEIVASATDLDPFAIL